MKIKDKINILKLEYYACSQKNGVFRTEEFCFSLDYIVNYMSQQNPIYDPGEWLIYHIISCFCIYNYVFCSTTILDYALNPITGNLHFILTGGPENVYYVFPSCRILED